MRKFMRMFRVYGLISVEDFFGWFCGIVTILATFVVCLLVQTFLPASRPSLTLAGYALGVTLGSTMLDAIPDQLGLYTGDELKEMKYYHQGPFRPPIVISGEMIPLLKILGGVLLAFTLES